MFPTNPYVWYQHPGSSFHTFGNSVSWPRGYYHPSYYYDYYNQSYQIDPQQGVTIEEVQEVHEESRNVEIIDISNDDSEMDTIDELKSYEEEEAIANEDLDAPLYSPISTCSSLSVGTEELIAGNLVHVHEAIDGGIDANEIPQAAVEFDSRISGDSVEDDQVVVGSVMENENPADLQVEVHDEVGLEPELIDFGSYNNVQRIQVRPIVRRSSRLLKKSQDDREDADLDESPKKKVTRWMTRKRCDCCNEFSKH